MKRRRFSPEFKTKVVLEALKERCTLKDLALKHKIHPQQITNWKTDFLKKASVVFTGVSKDTKSDEEHEKDALLRTIGELTMENNFLKKKLK